MSQKNTVTCDCGCGARGPAHRMVLVRASFSANQRTKLGRAFMVLPECEAPFTRQYVQSYRLQDLAVQNMGAGILRRISLARRVWVALLDIHARKQHPRRWAIRGVWQWILGA